MGKVAAKNVLAILGGVFLPIVKFPGEIISFNLVGPESAIQPNNIYTTIHTYAIY